MELDSKSSKMIMKFHLNNREANKQLDLEIDDKNINNIEAPKYLGVKLDCTLKFRQHLEEITNKLISRNNIIFKPAGTSGGCHVKVK